MEPRTIHVNSPNEQGDIEAANGTFKRGVEQHLLMRGNRDFPALPAYETFLWICWTSAMLAAACAWLKNWR